MNNPNTDQVIMLGTGDPLNHERVQSSLALPLADDDILLVDVTSGTALLRQLHDAGLALDRIRHVFITHRHFDHAGGLAPLLVALVPIADAEVTVYAPRETIDALHALLHMTIPGVDVWLGQRLRWRTLASGTTVDAGSALVTPFAVDHGLECVGLRIEVPGGVMVFSADTRPAPALVEYARDADLLIHEAYGLVHTADEAHTFGHSTAADAGTAAVAADARRLLLTHFRASQYADPADLAGEAAEMLGRPVEVAHDLGIVTLKHRPGVSQMHAGDPAQSPRSGMTDSALA